jgi:hypothetical protein
MVKKRLMLPSRSMSIATDSYPVTPSSSATHIEVHCIAFTPLPFLSLFSILLEVTVK